MHTTIKDTHLQLGDDGMWHILIASAPEVETGRIESVCREQLQDI